MPGIWASPFSIHVVRDSVVTLLPFTVNVPRLEIPLRPGPIFFALLAAKWHMVHFFSNTSLPPAAEPAPPGLADFLGGVLAGGSCAGSAPGTARDSVPKISIFRFTLPHSLNSRFL